jgi:acyl carrier protein
MPRMPTDHDARAIVVAAIAAVAPDVDVATLDPDADLRDVAGLDSMDFLNVVAAIHTATGLEIPERDYPLLGTLGGFVAYVEAGSSSR